MNQIGEDLRLVVTDFYEKYKNLEDNFSSIKLSSDKWSLKEIIGHLIDSASNNHQRFVRLQIEKEINFPSYKTEEWVIIQEYYEVEWNNLIELWKDYNELLVHLIKKIKKENFNNLWITEGSQPITLAEIVKDYPVHLKSHLAHFEERLAETINQKKS